MIGTSDIHGLVDWQYGIEDGGHRPVNLVLANERSIASIQEAMRERRTIAFFKDLIVGKTEFVKTID